MANFDAVDAGLEGFRLTRERPKAVLVWAGLTLLASLIGGALLVSLAGEALNEFLELGRGRTDPDPDQALRVFGALGPAAAILVPLALLFNTVLVSAMYRAILRPEEGGPGYLKLGGDELRLVATTVLLALLYLGLVLACGLALGLLGMMGEAVGGFLGGLIGFLSLIAIIAAVVFFAVRFSLAMPATFAERRIQVFQSWRLTKGRFWPLLGAYVLAIALALIIQLLAFMIYFALAALLFGGVDAAASVMRPDYDSIGSWLTPAMGLYLLISAVVSAIGTAIIVGVSAGAYRMLRDRPPESAPAA